MTTTTHPARRLRHGERPTEPLVFEDAAANKAAEEGELPALPPNSLDHLEALAKAATRGPWKKDNRAMEVGPVSDEDDQSYGMVIPLAGIYGENRDADAAFIAEANPAAVLALIAAARQKMAEVEAPQAVAYLDLDKLSAGGMAYATSFRTSDKQTALIKAIAADRASRQVANKAHWGYCPECGSTDSEEPRNGMGHFCNNCGQEWHADIDYTDVVQTNLARGAVAQHPASVLGKKLVTNKAEVDLSSLKRYDRYNRWAADGHFVNYSELVEFLGRATPPATTGASIVLTDERIDEIAKDACADKRISWSAFRKDSDGKFTIPVLCKEDYDLAREVAAQAGQLAVPGWISTDDRLPENGKDVIILYWPYNNHENERVAGTAHHVEGTFYDEDGNDMHPPSHWMPFVIPEAAPSPEKESK